MRHALAALLVICAASANAAELVTKPSPYSVAETIDRLEAAVEAAGATVFARIDHAKGAMSVDMELRPTEMLMFGNPALGTPALQAAQTSGLDLPLRVVAYESDSGEVFVSYHDPKVLVSHGLSSDAEVLAKMTGALDKLTTAATAE